MIRPEASISRDPITLAIAAHERAISLREATRLPEAERACRKALALYEQAEGRSHPDVANALVELGQILEARDQLRPARTCHQRALTILTPSHARRGAKVDDADAEDPDIARLRIRARVFLAGIDRTLGAYAPADRGYAIALGEARRLFGPDDPDVAGILNNLGVLRKYQGRFAEATAFYRRALPLLEKTGDRGALATLFHNMGGIEHSRGRHAAGEPHARRSVELREAELGPDHVAVAADVAALAALVEGRGRLDEAAALYERALGIFRRKLGPQSAEESINMSSLAALRQQQGKIPEAEALYARALVIQERVFGRGHPEVAMTLNNLACLKREKGELGQARSLYERARKSFLKTLGPQHPHTRLCVSNHRAVVAEQARARARALKPPRRTGR
jgi:tetratricopeptide (TPR) repeat protein